MAERVVVITGGSKGIGASTALKFSENGDKVVVLYGSDDNAAEDLTS